MEVKPGYKRTEVGMLPADWDAGPIGRAVERLEAGASVNSEKDEAPEFDSYPCVLKTGAAKEGSFDPRESKKVARRDLWRLKVSLRKDTILVSRMNTVELVGESGYVDADYPNLFVPDRMWMTTIRSTGRVHPRWLSYTLTWQPVKSQISASATGTSGSMKNISKPSFRAVEIPYPPVEEQRAIAEALSDADALIESLEQLLAKNRRIKQGAMQELLTGKKRLPGFSGEWETKKVCELGNVVTGGTPSTRWLAYWGEEFPWVTPTDISGQKDIHATERQLTSGGRAALRGLPANSVLVTCIASIGKNAILRRPGACNQQINAVVPTAENNADFLYYLFEAGKQYLLANAGITATLIISKRDFSELSFCVPNAEEQSTIAAILSDMDAEIAALEARLAKARAVKQGMMQDLLTGRIRLV